MNQINDGTNMGAEMERAKREAGWRVIFNPATPQPIVTIGEVLYGVKPIVVQQSELIDEPKDKPE